MAQGVKQGLLCRYEYDKWVDDDGYFFIKVTAIEFERATAETFTLNARRRATEVYTRLGIVEAMKPARTNWLTVFDIARDWASQMPEAYTFRSIVPIPAEVLNAAAA